MPVIVLATSGRDVLIGQGGQWLVDTTPDKEIIYTAQKITGFPNTEEGKQAATAKAAIRARQLGPDIKFTELEWKTNPDRYSTRFLTPINPPGFIKGTYPDDKYPNETPRQAAIREFREETGYSIERFPLIEVAPKIFRIEIPQDQKSAVIQSWRNMGAMGELFELRWEPNVDIRKDAAKLNSESRPAVAYLPTYYAGTRRRRRRRVFRSRKQKR